MRNWIFYTVFLALSFGLAASCAVGGDGVFGGLGFQGEEVVDVAVSFRVNSERVCGVSTLVEGDGLGKSVVDPGVETDEGTAVGYVPRDVWVIQYGGLGDDAVLLGRPRYVELSLEGGADIQAVASSVENTLIFVANTHDSNIEFGDIGTLGKMRHACKRIASERDCYGSNFYTSKDLIFSGKWEGVVTGGAIWAELFRNIARVDFTLRNGLNSGLTLLSVQLCGVPRNFYYISGVVRQGGVFPVNTEFFDYPAQEFSAPESEPGGESEFTFYVPENQRGVAVGSTSGSMKSALAPGGASYFKITAVDAQGQGYVYKVYPGANMVDDYNLLANHRYVVEFSINTPGDASSDGRVEFYGKQDLPSSNSYLLNPSPSGTKALVVTVPIDRVNEFWTSQDQTLTISPGQGWTVELLWQDTSNPDFIRFIDPVSGQSATSFSGVGPDQRIELTLPTGAEGNAVIGLRKVGRESVGYLWSWHFWVTDYDPEHRAAPSGGQYVYSVPGGYVHRYEGNIWKTGVYRDKYIMDRNLGARSASYTAIGALYYQFGRKDPMPGDNNGNQLYNINGQALAVGDPLNAAKRYKDAVHGVTISTGVLDPTCVYSKRAELGYGDWTNQGKKDDHAWNNPIAGINLKSIYDPCPVGWKMPVLGLWSDFRFDSNPLRSTTMSMDRDERLGWSYLGENGLRYWPLNQPVGGSIYFPATGFKSISGGGTASLNAQVDVWLGTTTSEFVGADILAKPTQVCNPCNNYRAFGFQVRCIQE